ncbi:hypothetical protein NMY22_g2829 [Coprinellus aureogranulatus]|nr:hypothetical protein NMY22_g2829 [Coprinellus aureogranulatus]
MFSKHVVSAERIHPLHATLAKEIRATCKKFMSNTLEIFVDDETKLTLHGLQQHYVKLEEVGKNRKLNELLDNLEFNQSVARAIELDKPLVSCTFPSIAVHSGLQQEERIKRYTAFKAFEKRILVATDIFGRGIDVEGVNIVIDYDCPPDADSYLHRVGRAGRFGTKGLAITFVSSEADQEVMKQIQSRFEVAVPELPDHIDPASYKPLEGSYTASLSLIGERYAATSTEGDRPVNIQNVPSRIPAIVEDLDDTYVILLEGASRYNPDLGRSRYLPHSVPLDRCGYDKYVGSPICTPPLLTLPRVLDLLFKFVTSTSSCFRVVTPSSSATCTEL